MTNERETACCDGMGQVHHGEGALGYVTLCRNPGCVARRERAWAIECGEIKPARNALYVGDRVRVLRDWRPGGERWTVGEIVAFPVVDGVQKVQVRTRLGAKVLAPFHRVERARV